VEGRLDWFSVPIKIVRGTVDETIHVNDRFKWNVHHLRKKYPTDTADTADEEDSVPTPATPVSSVAGPAPPTQGQTTAFLSGETDRTSLRVTLMVGALPLFLVT
jgi:hypothetical protein